MVSRERLRRLARTLSLGTVLGLATGYVAFYGVFSLASFPASSDPSLVLILGILALTSILVGLATEDLVQVVLASFVALLLSIVTAIGIALSPSLAGVIFVSPDTVAVVILRYGFLLFGLGFVADLIGGTLGLALRERYFYRDTGTVLVTSQRK